ERWNKRLICAGSVALLTAGTQRRRDHRGQVHANLYPRTCVLISSPARFNNLRGSLQPLKTAPFNTTIRNMNTYVDPDRVPSRALHNGMAIPSIGLGTFGNDRFSARAVANAVDGAVRAGYRYIDCAAAYGNEAEIGEAIGELFHSGVVTRRQLTVSSKVWNNRHSEVAKACEESLRDLGLEYLDLYLVHWPFPNHHPPGAAPDSRQPDSRPFSVDEYLECWGQMESLVRRGLVRAIGTSNMTIVKLEAILPHCSIMPVVNQMELHPAFQQPSLFDYCAKKNILPVAFSPLGSPIRPERDRMPDDISVFEIPEIVTIARSRNIHPALVCLKWAVKRGQVPVPFSVSEAEYVANLRSTTEDLLTDEEMRRISIVDRQCRLIKGVVFLWNSAPSWRSIWDEESRADT
ncbi:MAG TPA: aldo/keto reductase, partial [Spirochaetia bacterium]|nr:aldo/keto reductase [Spirochaetia bacterium]